MEDMSVTARSSLPSSRDSTLQDAVRCTIFFHGVTLGDVLITLGLGVLPLLPSSSSLLLSLLLSSLAGRGCGRTTTGTLGADDGAAAASFVAGSWLIFTFTATTFADVLVASFSGVTVTVTVGGGGGDGDGDVDVDAAFWDILQNFFFRFVLFFFISFFKK